MKKLLFISSNQYGSNTDMMKYCLYLSDFYDITFLCYHHMEQPIIHPDDNKFNVIYIENYRPGLISKLRLVYHGKKYIKKINPDVILINFFPFCSLFNYIVRGKKIIIDIRSGCVEESKIIRTIKDMIRSFEANRFKYISVISKGLMEKLKLDESKTTILPLGADRAIDINESLAEMYCMNLLYVGTFYQRKIEDTINGFKLFYDEYQDKISCTYTIIGFGEERDEENIHDLINKLDLSNVVSFVGRKNHKELPPYYLSHNIGVSYIPITEYFQNQPPTKTYEYIQNGLICIATKTNENSKVINDSNGILIEEGPDAFYHGLKHVYYHLKEYDRTKIMINSEQYNWRSIVLNIVKPFIDKDID